MLQKNDKKVDFSKSNNKPEIKQAELKAILGKKQTVSFQLVNSLSKVDKKGRRTFKRRHIIEAYFQNEDKEGNTSEYRYFKNKRPGKRVGEIVYTPDMLTFENNGRVDIFIGPNQKENLDLFHFLYLHPWRANNPLGSGSRRPMWFLIDENAQALEMAQKREANSEMERLLWNKETRKTDEELRLIAQALRIPEVDEMIIERIQVEIDKTCKAKPQRFLRLCKMDQETEMRAAVQEAIDASVLIFDIPGLKWILVDGKNRAVLCPVRKTDDETTALIHFLKNQDENDHFGKIVELIKESKVQSVK